MTYETDFYPHADVLADLVDTQVWPLIRTLSPRTKIAFMEMGAICESRSTLFPPLYWVALASLYAYEFARLAVAGVHVLTASQYAGNPPIPEWHIPNTQ